MKTIKVPEATKPQLNWLVAKCEGLKCEVPAYADTPWVRVTDTSGLQYVCPDYSTDWAQGGPIIEREGLLVRPQPGNGWDSWKHGADEPCYSIGPTPLIAVMRCYVSNCLGSEVEVPEELL